VFNGRCHLLCLADVTAHVLGADVCHLPHVRPTSFHFQAVYGDATSHVSTSLPICPATVPSRVATSNVQPISPHMSGRYQLPGLADVTSLVLSISPPICLGQWPISFPTCPADITSHIHVWPISLPTCLADIDSHMSGRYHFPNLAPISFMASAIAAGPDKQQE
jgi:hypothetical protein